MNHAFIFKFKCAHIGYPDQAFKINANSLFKMILHLECCITELKYCCKTLKKYLTKVLAENVVKNNFLKSFEFFSLKLINLVFPVAIIKSFQISKFLMHWGNLLFL